MTHPKVLSKSWTAAVLLVLGACPRSGNVVSEERATLAELHPASGVNVSIKDLQLKVLDIKASDGTTHKDLSLAFSAEGEILQKYSPAFKAVCALPDMAITDGTLVYGNTPVDNKLTPSLPLPSLDAYLGSVRNTEPSACEIEIRLRDRASAQIASKVPPEEKSVGKACYRLQGTKRSLTEGACPAGLVNRKVMSAASAVSPRMLSVRWRSVMSPPHVLLIPGVVLTVNKSPTSDQTAVRVSATCKDEKLEEAFTLGKNQVAGLEPGETTWVEISAFGLKQLPAAAKQCEFTMKVQEGEPITETVQYCISGDTFKEGPCPNAP